MAINWEIINDTLFENLTQDLLQKELDLTLEGFAKGRDGGIDLRHHKQGIIVQVKNYYNTPYSTFKSKLKKEELPKVIKNKPKRYILAVRMKLTPPNKDEILNIFRPYILTPADIYGLEDIQNLFRKYPEIEDRYSFDSRDEIKKALTQPLSPDKPILKGPDFYMPRGCSSPEDRKQMSSELFSTPKTFLTDLFPGKNHIVLLSEAGMGKTSELENIAFILSKQEQSFVILEELKYWNTWQSIKALLIDKIGEGWITIDNHNLFLILDGLDEIPQKYRQDFILELEKFKKDNPLISMLISCRRNFYEMNKVIPTIEDFDVFFLNTLDNTDIQEFLKHYCSQEVITRFWEGIQTHEISHIITNPYYLKGICDILNGTSMFPASKVELFEKLLSLRKTQDKQHFPDIRTLSSIEEKECIENLEKLAFVMSVAGKVFITQEEYDHIIKDHNQQETLKMFTVWQKSHNEERGWEFEHRNFQEFLTTRCLSRLNLKHIKKIVTSPIISDKIIPFWINTIGFLTEIDQRKQVQKWISTIEAEVLLSVETDRLTQKQKYNIFKKVFLSYSQKGSYLISFADNTLPPKLAHICDNIKSITFLLKQLKSDNTVFQKNSLFILRFCKCLPDKYMHNLIDQLMDLIEHDDNEIIFNALAVLGNKIDYSNTRIDTIVQTLKESPVDSVRAGLYYFILLLNKVDDYLDIFLYGIRFLDINRLAIGTKRKSRDIMEKYWLKEGLKAINTTSSLKKIIIFFKEHINEAGEFYDLLINLFTKFNKHILTDLKELFIDFIINSYLSYNWQIFKPVFEDVENEKQEFLKYSFKYLIENNNNKTYNTLFMLIKTVITKEDFDTIFLSYKDKILDKDILLALQRPFSDETAQSLGEFLENNLGKEYRLVLSEPFNEKEDELSYFHLLFNYNHFFVELEKIFTKFNKSIREIEPHFRYNPENNPGYSPALLKEVYTIARKYKITNNDMLLSRLKKNWQRLSIDEIYRFFLRNSVPDLNREEKNYIYKWCENILNNADFSQVMTESEDGKSWTFNSDVEKAIYFFRKLNFQFPKNLLLKFLEFNYNEENQWSNYSYLEPYLSKDEIWQQMLKNLKEKQLTYPIVTGYINFAIKHEIKEILPFTQEFLVKYYKSENHIPQNIKRVFCKWALKKDLEDVFARIDDIQILNMFHNFRLEKKYIPYFEDKFLNLLKKKRKKPMINDQYIIALTCLKNHKATKKYLHTIIRRKNYSLKLITADRVFEPVMSFIDHVKYLKYLNKVFKVSCKKTFVDNSMMSIKQDLAHVWMKIGVRSPGNFKRVRKNLKKLKRYHPFFINNILIEIEKAFLKQEFIFIPIKEAISVSKSIIHGK